MMYFVAQSCPILCEHMDCRLSGSSVHGDSPGKNTGVGCHFPLWRIFPTQRSSTGLPHFRADSLLSEPPGKPYSSDTYIYDSTSHNDSN